jgi:uncharacterized Zn finger protein (UPF0148 family)/uncharacterized membrane protein
MAYCDRCGAYIPDGWTACPGCGYDKEKETAQAQQAAAAQAHQAEQEKFAREEAEKRRAQRQAYDKVWAENEQRRRREEEEFRRRQQEQEERNRQERERRRQEQDLGGVHVYVDADGRKNVRVGDRVHVVVNADGSKEVKVDGMAQEYGDADRKSDFDFGKAGDKVREFVNSDAFNKAEETFSTAGGKILPLLSYLGPLCFIPLILGKDRFTSFHARQGLRLFIWSAVLEAVGGFFGIGWAVGFFQILMSIIGIKNVINGEEKKLPYIGG